MGRKKLGANESCWCGSEIKYKRCHRDREREAPIHPKEFDNKYRRPFQHRVCLHPSASKTNCGGKIVAAHTIQRAGAISKIIDATNHVLTFYPPKRDAKGQFKIHSRGCREASTFMGFCNTHDTELFSDLETRPFTGDEKQCFLVGYRALSHEVYQKSAVNAGNPIMRDYLDRGRTREEQELTQRMIDVFAQGTKRGDEEINAFKSRYDAALKANDFSDINYAVISFDGDISVAGTGAVTPDFNVDGTPLQNVADLSRDLEGLTFGVVSTATGGAFVFSWPSGSSICNKFVESLLSEPQEDIPNILVEFMFGYVENTYFSKAWWDSLSKPMQDRITTLATTPVQYGHSINYSRMKLVNWKITGVETKIT